MSTKLFHLSNSPQKYTFVQKSSSKIHAIQRLYKCLRSRNCYFQRNIVYSPYNYAICFHRSGSYDLLVPCAAEIWKMRRFIHFWSCHFKFIFFRNSKENSLEDFERYLEVFASHPTVGPCHLEPFSSMISTYHFLDVLYS